MQSLSQQISQQTISERGIPNLGARLVLRYLTTPMTWRDYKELACWLGVYSYTPTNHQKPHEETDRPVLEYLVNKTNLTTTQIYHKLIFLKDLNHGLKTAAIKLLLPTDSSFMP